MKVRQRAPRTRVAAPDPLFPRTRADCLPGAPERRSGAVTCPFPTCRYHLLGELARRPDSEAVPAMLARLEGLWLDSCALDVADALEREDRGMAEGEIALMLGVSRDRVVQLSAEARSRYRRALRERGGVSDE